MKGTSRERTSSTAQTQPRALELTGIWRPTRRLLALTLEADCRIVPQRACPQACGNVDYTGFGMDFTVLGACFLSRPVELFVGPICLADPQNPNKSAVARHPVYGTGGLT